MPLDLNSTFYLKARDWRLPAGFEDSAPRREDESSQTEFDDFPNAFHASVEVFGLNVTAPQHRDSGDIVAVFVSFDDNRELSLSFHENDFSMEKIEAIASS
jgi:hypothetical protein